VACIIAFPLDEVLVLIAILVTIEHAFDLVFSFVVNLNWWWWGRVFSIYFVAGPGGESVDMEYRVLVHEGGEIEAISELAGAFEDFIWA
jgi:hypothetical protein